MLTRSLARGAHGLPRVRTAAGIKLDRPYAKNADIGVGLAFITDPWGTSIEINERPNPAYIN